MRVVGISRGMRRKKESSPGGKKVPREGNCSLLSSPGITPHLHVVSEDHVTHLQVSEQELNPPCGIPALCS